MSDSDSDSDYFWEDTRHRVKPSVFSACFCFLEEIFDRWLRIPADTRREAGQRMRVCAFWLPILLQREDSSPTARWAIQIGLVKTKNSEDITLKQLQRIEILEAILNAMEKGSVSSLCKVLDDALHWLERTGEPDIRRRVLDLGPPQTCLIALHLIFTECKSKFGFVMFLIQKSEEMKKKGNDNFIRHEYEEAVKFYSKAIKYYPDNHFIYGNRGHYRYCEALFSMGKTEMAIQANISAQKLCKDDHEGLKDLEQQHQKFITSVAEPKGIFPPHIKAAICKELRSMVQDAHTALADLRTRNAEQAFSQALVLLETTTPKVIIPLTISELSEAQKLMEKIKSFEERTFQCLVYYAIGRVYLKENRFAVALEQFSDSLQMVKNQITPGKLTWPLTKEIVKVTQPDYFKEILESAIELCKFPPIPDAICRLEKCHGSLKTEIYFTDPDFKGFIQICCCQSCTVEYHITCWKTLKTSTFFEKNEKDFLQEACLTPDCVGQICSIKIFGPTGLVKCKFEAAIPKTQTPKKPKVNQKCTSLKKLKSKEERRLKRKQHKQSFNCLLAACFVLSKQVLISHFLLFPLLLSAWLMYRDRVLLQISQNIELLREEKGLHVSALTSSLRPWLELDSSRGNKLAERMLNWQQEQLKTLGQAVELLLERRNRVWACVLLQLLSSCLDINAKLNNWACQLNNAGLNAAKSFIERHAGRLEQLDLALLLSFGPLQEMIIEKLGTRPEFFSSIGLTVTEYLKQASPHDMRLFIWTLEEHRDEYLSCHTILDEYFDMMGTRGRKKKQREPKGVIVLSGMRGITPRDEWDQDFFEDDSLSFLHPVDPFSVPSHLRDQVADFEDQYNGTRHRSHFKTILDNHPDPTKESLYDYFAQILEEHGPLVAEDPLLVGELENFPPVAQLKIDEAGGFESFLLESLRFIKMGRCIGLAKHAVSLQQAGHGASLDDLDVLMDPDTNSLSPDLYESAFTSYPDDFSSTQTEIFPMLPNPYPFGFQSVTNKELALFQHKLEEEVKKDQKEKKANQEVLKSLKLEIEELVEEHGSNHSATEKMSLEDEIKRCKVLLDLMRFVQEFRSSSGGSLSNMALQDVVGGVTQLILDHQVGVLNMEDPCIICHDDMSPDDICVLECRHSFHKECIKSWLKEQSTCPTCRDHALLPEDFPVLPGRRRQAP
uniref:RING-type E3 ubiquitin transferase n=1 Tax=Seriola dumerili TaxID=41447 RepID=A0A3B4T8S4_SERDU